MSHLYSDAEIEEIKKQAVAEYLVEHNKILKNRWIPCSERLPNKYCHCLVTRKNYYHDGFDTDIQEDVYIELEGEWGWQSNFEGLFGEIIAWMPLPEPYNPTEN